MKRTVITGGTGFVGANLARRLLADGHEVHLLVRQAHRPWRIEPIRSDVHLHEADIRDPKALVRALAAIRPDWVFHLATHGAYPSQTDMQEMLETNVMGTANLVHASLQAGFEAFVNTGSSSEYGFKDHAPTETEWLDPNSYYAVTKASATLFCRYTAQSQGANITTLRLYSAYGPYEAPTRLMPALILEGLHDRLPPLVNPDVARDYVYVEDVIQAYLLAADAKGQELGAVYNVGTGTETTLEEAVAVARRVLDATAEPQWGSMEGRNWDTKSWVSDSRRAREALGWEPQYDLEAGIREMVTWFQDHPTMLEMYRARRR